MDDDVIEGLSDEPSAIASAALRAILAARERATEAFQHHKKALLGAARAPAGATRGNS